LFDFCNLAVISGYVTAPVIVIFACKLIPIYKVEGIILRIAIDIVVCVKFNISKLNSDIRTVNAMSYKS
jgi:hypothetical protein